MYIGKANIKVRYVETDKMGIVHHSNYYSWFEVGRGEFITESGFTYQDLECQGMMLPIIESSCKYIEGAKYPEELVIETFIASLNGIKIIFNYNVVRKSDSKIIATGSTTHVFVNDDFQIINIKKKKPELWAMLDNIC
ncbi:MAG: thioesterase family protein [Eubacteriales bacterium]